MKAAPRKTDSTSSESTPVVEVTSGVNSSASAEEADVAAGVASVGSGVVLLGRHGPRQVSFSVVNGRAIFEGDIELGTPEELDENAKALAAAAGEMQAAVVSDTSKRWPQGRVPYEPAPPSSPIENIVNAAIEVFSRYTPVRFVPRVPADVDYVAFEVAAFCSSRVGRVGGRQVVRLTSTASVGNAIHELNHVLGLWHEQSREDRDTYVKVRWENILAGYEHNFRQQITDGDDVGLYDFGSIMHYPPDAFSSNGLPTLEAIDGNSAFGQRDGLSGGDISALRRMYSAAAPAPSSGNVTPSVGNGVQFRVNLRGREVARVVTEGWPIASAVHWNVICTQGPVNTGPLISWEYTIGLSNDEHAAYFFSITNLTDQPVTAEARYAVIR